MDVKYALLNEDLEEEVYIEQSEGFILGNVKNILWKLNKKIV